MKAAHSRVGAGSSITNYIAGDPDEAAEQAAKRFAAGVEELFVFTHRLWTEEDIGLLANVIANLKLSAR